MGAVVLPPDPFPRHNGQAVWSAGKVHWYGGRAETAVDAAGKTYYGNRESGYSVYDPSTDSWKSSKWTDNPQDPAGIDTDGNEMVNNPEGTWPGTSQSFAFDDDNDGTEELYVHGGYPTTNISFSRYDPNTNSWSQVGPFPGFSDYGFSCQYLGVAALYVDGTGQATAYCFGGGWWGPDTKSFAKYDFTPGGGGAGTWTELHDGPIGLLGGVGAVINGKVYVAAGSQLGPLGSYDNRVWAYDIASATWSASPVANLLIGVQKPAVCVYNGKMYIIGGQKADSGAGSNIRDIQVFDPSGAPPTVTTLDLKLPVGMSAEGAVISPSGTLYVGSGWQGDDFLTVTTSTNWWKADLAADPPPTQFTPIANDPAYFPYQDWDPGAADLSGRVIGRFGDPVPGAVVGIKASANAAADAKYYAVANASGIYGPVSVRPGNWLVAAWKAGWTPGPDTALTMDTSNRTLDVSLDQWAGGNIAPGSTLYADSEAASYPKANVIDRNQWTRWSTDYGTGANHWIIIDLGTARDVSDVIIYWEFSRAAAYSVDVTTGDPNPSGTPTWTTIYSTTEGAGWNAGNQHFVDPIRFYPTTVSARGVRVHCTAYWPSWVDNYSAWEIQLHSTTYDPNRIGNCRRLPLGSTVSVVKPVTVSGGTIGDDFYIEEPDRSSGIRVITHPSLGIGRVDVGYLAEVTGTLTITGDGELVVDAAAASGWYYSGSPKPLGMNCKAAATVMAQGLLVRAWGKVKSLTADGFMLDDGSNPTETGIPVVSASAPGPGVFVAVEGAVGMKANSTAIFAARVEF
jgi:hypothetical protein